MQRKRYPKEFKEQIIHEAQDAGNAAQVAKRHGISPKSLYAWMAASKRRAFVEAPAEAKRVDAYQPSAQLVASS